MDNVTHSLTGLALSRAGLDRFCSRAVWLLVLSANAPDADIIATRLGAFRYLQVHRGYTHSFIGAPAMAALCVLVIAGLFRQRLPWLRAFLLCLLGVASHLLLDWTNSYGVRPLIPFSSRWFHLDINGLFDVWILLALMIAAVWPLFSTLVNREIGERRVTPGRTLAMLALLFFLAFDVGRTVLHNRVVAQLDTRLYEGVPPLQVAALPDGFNPLNWTAIIETPATYRELGANALDQLNPEEAAVYYKPPVSASLTQARSQDPFRYFLYFARFPVWSIQPVSGEHSHGTRFDLTDLRFGTPGAGAFHCVGYEDQTGRLIDRAFTYGSGTELGWGESPPR